MIISDTKKSRLPLILLFSFLLLLLILFLFRLPLLQALGEYLVTQDSVEEAQIVVILQGSLPDRILHGISLYQRGYAQRVVMVRSHDFSCYDLMEEYGLELPGNVDLNHQVAVQLGVPQEDIIILPGKADSTFDEALIVNEYLQEEGVSSLYVVTSKYHSTRSKKIFTHVLGEERRVLSWPSPYDPFDPTIWWQERRQARNLLLEYLKLINFYLIQRW